MGAQWTRFATVALIILALSLFALSRCGRTVSADAGGKIVAAGDMAVPRFDHTATLLPSGKVLIAAGMARDGMPEPNAELYDPHSNRFTSIGELASPRGWGSTATLLQDGKVLITGGATGSWCGASCYLATAELYHPSTNTFTSVGNMIEPRAGAVVATRLLLRNVD